MIPAERTVAILLAAGRSERFGTDDKLLAPFRGRPLACHAAAMLASIGFQKMFAVCRADSPLAETLSALGFAIVPVSTPDAGIGQSLADGMKAAQVYDADAALVHLADMPLVRADHVEALLLAYQDGSRDIIASAHAGIAMPPALFGHAHFPSLCNLHGDTGARAMLADAVLIAGDAAMLHDVDHPSDLNR